MTYEFVGTHPESLASGRPLVFGDQVSDSDMVDVDARLKPLLVPIAPAAPTTTSTPDTKAS